MSFKKFEIFKEITIGGDTKEELLNKLIDSQIQFNDYAKILFEHPQFRPTNKKENVKLVKLNLGDLNLEETCSFEEFSFQASVCGLKLCPLYLSAYLRLNFLYQEAGPYLTIASEKPSDHENCPNGFYLRNFENKLWLRGYKADGFDGWPEKNEFVFLLV